MSSNTQKHDFSISKNQREAQNGHRAYLIWFTGLSGSGKSTLANLVEVELHNIGLSTYILDGDNVRQGINNDLSFSPADRSENIRRIGEISNLMLDAGIITLATFVSPYIKDRGQVKNIVGDNNFIEIFIKTSLVECERRDVKGLYKKARAGGITNMTGISSPYEPPVNADLEIVTDGVTVEVCVETIKKFIIKKLKATT